MRYQQSAASRKTIQTKRSKRIAAQEKLTKCKGTGASENNSKKKTTSKMEHGRQKRSKLTAARVKVRIDTLMIRNMGRVRHHDAVNEEMDKQSQAVKSDMEGAAEPKQKTIFKTRGPMKKYTAWDIKQSVKETPSRKYWTMF